MGERLDVVDQCRPSEVADLGGEGRAQPRHRAASLHRLEHRRLLARDVRAGADDELERAAVEKPGGAELADRVLEPRAGGCVLLPEVDVAVLGLGEAHRDEDSPRGTGADGAPSRSDP